MNHTNKVLSLANKILVLLKPFCKKIQIAGSIRRGKPNPRDIDIVLIPKDKNKIEAVIEKLGNKIRGGEKIESFKIKRINVELYYTNDEEWGATLLAYSGRRGSNIGLRIIARMKGFKLTQHGLFDRKNGKRVAGKTEREIYEKLGREYKEAGER